MNLILLILNTAGVVSQPLTACKNNMFCVWGSKFFLRVLCEDTHFYEILRKCIVRILCPWAFPLLNSDKENGVSLKRSYSCSSSYDCLATHILWDNNNGSMGIMSWIWILMWITTRRSTWSSKNIQLNWKFAEFESACNYWSVYLVEKLGTSSGWLYAL